MSRTLEITVISAQGLPMKSKKVFVTVAPEGPASHYHKNLAKTTTVDSVGGCNPFWNNVFVMQMPPNAHSILVQVQRKGSSSLLGTARIPASEFTAGSLPDNYLHFLSYRLRNDKGDRGGIVNVSVRVINAPAAADHQTMMGTLPQKISPSMAADHRTVFGTLPQKNSSMSADHRTVFGALPQRNWHEDGTVVGIPAVCYGV